MTLNISKITGQMASGNLSINFSAQPADTTGKMHLSVNLSVSSNKPNSIPQTESQNETYNYYDTPANIKTQIENDLKLGEFISVEA